MEKLLIYMSTIDHTAFESLLLAVWQIELDATEDRDQEILESASRFARVLEAPGRRSRL